MSPSPDPRSLWKGQPVAPTAFSPGRLAARARTLETTVLARNRTEYIAGGLVALLMLVLGALSLHSGISTPDDAVATLGLFTLAAGAVVVCVQLYRRTGRPRAMSGAVASLAAYRAELVRQRDALRAIWLWYLAPMLPGILLIYGADLFRPQPAWWLTFSLLGATLAFFILVAALNHRAAAHIDTEIEALDAEAD